MRKIYILLDDWNNDRNFILNELIEITKEFEVTIIANKTSDMLENIPENCTFLFYERKMSARAILHGIHFFIDKDFCEEIRNIKREHFSFSKLMESLRFYINAELFFDFMKKNQLIENNSTGIYYSFWYFWKCYALTKHRANYPKINMISRAHEYDLYNVSIPSGYQPFKKQMDRQLDKLIFIADHGRDYYIQKYSFELTDKYPIYYLGTQDYGLQKNYLRNDTINLVSCSSIIPRKRVWMIVDALAQLKDISISWTHFGSGADAAELKKYTDELLGNKKNISYCYKGYTKHDEIMSYYSRESTDVFVMTAESEGNPVSVMEAMSFGIPVISVNINNMATMIKDNGIILNTASAECLADAIAEMHKLNDASIDIMRKNSRSLWEHNYNEVTNNKKFIHEVLDELGTYQ